MNNWEIEIHEGSNGQIVTSTVSAPNSEFKENQVITYPKEGATIPEAVVSYLESKDALMAFVQVMFVDDAPGGAGTQTMEISETESNLEWEDVNATSNGVVVVYHSSNDQALTHKKTKGKVKLGDKEV